MNLSLTNPGDATKIRGLGDVSISGDGFFCREIMMDEQPLEVENVSALEESVQSLKDVAAAEVIASQVSVQDSAVMHLQGETVTATNTGIMLASVQHFDASTSGIGSLFADTVHLHESQAGFVVGRQVTGELIRTKILLASKVEGQVETLIDTPRTLLFGISAGVATGLVLTLFRLILKRK